MIYHQIRYKIAYAASNFQKVNKGFYICWGSYILMLYYSTAYCVHLAL